jgi:thiol-disulfide isomerase/thioredoxin
MKIPSFRGLILAGLMILSVAGLRAQSYEAILADPATWPKEIEVNATTKGSVLQGDKVTGAALIGAGRKLAVLRLRPDGVVVRSGSANVLLPPDKTNVLTAAAGPAEPAATAAPEPAEPPARAAAEPAMAAGPVTAIQRALLGRLVHLENGGLKPYDMRKLNGVKFYGIMFSAGWCGPCREFAPHLLESYRSIRNIYPEFELVLVSNDRSPADMLAYMRDEKMPWPALKFSEIENTDILTKLGGPGIPCLVLIDADGRVLAHSFKGGDYVGPDSVLDATWRVLKKSRRG